MCRDFNYSTFSGYVSISAFTVLVGVPEDI